jgi:biopolymer transport protein TolQ
METVTLNEAAQLAATDFSLWALFIRADIVVKLVMLGLIFASVLSWSIIIEKTLSYRRVRHQADEFEAFILVGRQLAKYLSPIGVGRGQPVGSGV